MRAILISTMIAAGIGLAAAPGAVAAPVNGIAIAQAANEGLLTDLAHCRRYPHRHMKARPHGFGFGCPKRPKGSKG